MHKCILPWISVEATPMGTARPCCLATKEIPNIDLKKDTLEDAFYSAYMQDMRKAFSEGKKPGQCRNCWTEEDAGKKSKRQYMLDKFRHIEIDWENIEQGNGLQFLDLKLGNICNLKCRICGSWSSSKWAKEELDYKKDDNENHIARKWLKDGRWVRESNHFWENLDELLSDVKYFEFTGGEPWMIQEHFDLLKRAVDKGFAKDIDIHYNTNSTQFPKDPTIWKHFKHVQIAFSVDNTEQRFEYERFGAEWVSSNENIDKVHELKAQGYPITTQLCVTWNVQNIYYMDELLSWAHEVNFDSIHHNLMHDPWEFSLGRIPRSALPDLMFYLQKMRVKYPQYKNDIKALQEIATSSSQEDAEPLHNKLRKADLYRNQNFAESHTKMAKAINYEL